MSSMLIEQTRLLHQENERLERKLTDELKIEPKTHRERIYQQHILAKYVKGIQQNSRKLIQIYADKERSRKEEIESLAGHDFDSTIGRFYGRLKDVMNYHQRFPSTIIEESFDPEEIIVEQMTSTDKGEVRKQQEQIDKEKRDIRLHRLFNNPPVEFSGEEAYGRFLDLVSFHQEFIQLPVAKLVRDMGALFPKKAHPTSTITKSSDSDASGTDSSPVLSYSEYLEVFPMHVAGGGAVAGEPAAVATGHSNSMASLMFTKLEAGEPYLRYLQRLLDYLVDFQYRVEPLGNTRLLMDEAKETFLKKWAEGTCEGFPREDVIRYIFGTFVPPQFANDPLYCPILKKSFTNVNVFNARVQGKKYKKLVQLAELGVESEYFKKAFDSIRLVAETEAVLQQFIQSLGDVLDKTKNLQIKKETRTAEELQQELDMDELNQYEDPEAEADEDDPTISNPLNLPLGPDGKPIPYWLYKLHGLGIKYTCEICGDMEFFGPRAYERHFQEWRHAYGMKCLGIPNTRDFHNITKIEDAKKLLEKIQKTEKERTWKAEQEEEFEDSAGNVLNWKTYQDLQRQGLL